MFRANQSCSHHFFDAVGVWCWWGQFFHAKFFVYVAVDWPRRIWQDDGIVAIVAAHASIVYRSVRVSLAVSMNRVGFRQAVAGWPCFAPCLGQTSIGVILSWYRWRSFLQDWSIFTSNLTNSSCETSLKSSKIKFFKSKKYLMKSNDCSFAVVHIHGVLESRLKLPVVYKCT